MRRRRQTDVRHTLSHVLRRTARGTILQTLKKVNLRIIAASWEESPRGPVFSLTAGLKAATPQLCCCGGARRLLLVAPETVSPAPLVERLRHDAQSTPTVVANAEEDVLLCYEVEQLPLRHVAAAVLDRRFQNVEVATRLHTRIDVPWSPL